MSLIVDTVELSQALKTLSNKAKKQQNIYFTLITEIVKLHQEYRLAKNYDVSDKLRDVLASVGVKVIQGTAKYGGYENIPDNLKHVQVDDTWTLD